MDIELTMSMEYITKFSKERNSNTLMQVRAEDFQKHSIKDYAFEILSMSIYQGNSMKSKYNINLNLTSQIKKKIITKVILSAGEDI